MQFLFFAGQQALPASARLDTCTYYTTIYVVEWKPSDFIHLVISYLTGFAKGVLYAHPIFQL